MEAPPRYASPRPASPPRPPSPARACAYCGAECGEGAYERHLVTAHAQLLFHCEECDTYVDRKDFVLHMSVHAVRYAGGGAGGAARGTRKVRKRGDENEMTEPGGEAPPPAPPGNEFSDHSDAEYDFGPLPESVFEAIEDSQDGRPPAGVAAPPAPASAAGDEGPEDEVPESEAPEGEGPEDEVPEGEAPGGEGPADEVPEGEAPGGVGPADRVPAGKLEPPRKTRSCPMCSKVFTASSSYFYHVKHFHRRSQEHECDVCGKKFATRANLVQHGPLHSGECRFECQQCGKRFKSKASHYIHAQTHNDVKKYSCPQCPKMFRWRTHLHRHLKRHAAEKSHVCAECGRGFSVKCDLLRHARTHTAGNFACEKCGHKFAQLRYLNVHVEKKHSASLPHRGIKD